VKDTRRIKPTGTEQILWSAVIDEAVRQTQIQYAWRDATVHKQLVDGRTGSTTDHIFFDGNQQGM
jgi:hypothetical protein